MPCFWGSWLFIVKVFNLPPLDVHIFIYDLEDKRLALFLKALFYMATSGQLVISIHGSVYSDRGYLLPHSGIVSTRFLFDSRGRSITSGIRYLCAQGNARPRMAHRVIVSTTTSTEFIRIIFCSFESRQEYPLVLWNNTSCTSSIRSFALLVAKWRCQGASEDTDRGSDSLFFCVSALTGLCFDRVIDTDALI